MAEAQGTPPDIMKGGVVAYLESKALKCAEFYKKAFDAEQVHVNPPDESGRTMHVHLYINGSSVMLSDPYPDHGMPYVPAAGFSLMQPVSDVDAAWQKAVDAGCAGNMAPQDMFWGDRYAQCKDPFGITWAFVGPKKVDGDGYSCVDKRMSIYIGVGGWVFEDWRDNFYPKGLPQKRELEFAASKLTAIEVNGTYYGSQKPESFRRWHDETPKDFVFSLKGPRYATNRRVLAEAGGSIDKFFASGVTELKAKLGPVNWQFMATKKFDADDFAAFLKLLPNKVDGLAIRHVVEVRHDSFKDAAFVELCRKHSVGVVFAADSEFPVIADITADFIYARIMGTQEKEKLGYSKAMIAKWAARVQQWERGESPDLALLAPAAPKKKRDVFLFVISGAKARNPVAAQAIIAALA